MQMKMEIICKDFKHKKILPEKEYKKIVVDEPSTEYYIIPLSKDFSMETDGDVFKLTFDKQLLWLKQANHTGRILLKEYGFEECVLVKPDDMVEVYVRIVSDNMIRKNVWQSDNNVYMKKDFIGDYFLCIPVLDESLLDYHEFGEGIVDYQVRIITNEVLLKQVVRRCDSGGNLIVSNNFMLNKEALFIRVGGDEVGEFIK